MKTVRGWVVCASGLASVAGAAPQDGTVVVIEGEAVAGVGNVTRVDAMSVADSGAWYVEADTDFADQDQDSVVVDAGGLLYREGQALPAPLGATIDNFDSVAFDDAGRVAWNLGLDGTAGLDDDSGVFLNDVLLVQEGGLVGAPRLDPGTTWRGFFEARFAGPQAVVVLASVDDPTIPTTVDRAFVRLDLDAGGALVGAQSLVAEGDLLPGQSFPVKDFDTAPHNFACNANGALLHHVEFEGDLDDAIFLDDVLLAKEGQPSPVPGRNWGFLASPEVALNGAGDWAFSVRLDGDVNTDAVIVRNGAIVAQEGDPHPDLPPGAVLDSFGTAPIALAENGELLWYASWDVGDGTTDEGWFIDDRLWVARSTATVGGAPLTDLASVQDAAAMSPSGRYVLLEGNRAAGENGAFLFDRAAGLSPIVECFDANPGVLAYVGGSTTIGWTLDLSLDSPGATLGSLVFLMLSPTPDPSGGECGLFLTGIGELLVDFLPPNFFILGIGVTSGSPLTTSLPLPNNPNLVGSSLYLQGLFGDTLDLFDPIDLTNGLRLDFQAR